jgi:hypothetical protein
VKELIEVRNAEINARINRTALSTAVRKQKIDNAHYLALHGGIL